TIFCPVWKAIVLPEAVISFDPDTKGRNLEVSAEIKCTLDKLAALEVMGLSSILCIAKMI
ncbi:MAG: hypothetical protein RL463_845, partial [Bacteroidota bacterium]